MGIGIERQLSGASVCVDIDKAGCQNERHKSRIALEDLQGIRQRVTVRRKQRATLHSWGFYQLRAYVTYKAKTRWRASVPG